MLVSYLGLPLHRAGCSSLLAPLDNFIVYKMRFPNCTGGVPPGKTPSRVLALEVWLLLGLQL